MSRGMVLARERGTHVQILLGAYLLGGLSAAEEAAVREHLDRCVPCRAEHDELARIPGWLDMLAGPETAGGLELVTDAGGEDRPASG